MGSADGRARFVRGITASRSSICSSCVAMPLAAGEERRRAGHAPKRLDDANSEIASSYRRRDKSNGRLGAVSSRSLRHRTCVRIIHTVRSSRTSVGSCCGSPAWMPLLVSTIVFGYAAPGIQGGNFPVLLGSPDRLGGVFVTASIREFAPFVTAVMVAGVAGGDHLRSRGHAERGTSAWPSILPAIPKISAYTSTRPVISISARKR
jgi:hypothetical protein